MDTFTPRNLIAASIRSARAANHCAIRLRRMGAHEHAKQALLMRDASVREFRRIAASIETN